MPRGDHGDHMVGTVDGLFHLLRQHIAGANGCRVLQHGVLAPFQPKPEVVDERIVLAGVGNKHCSF